MTDTDRDPRPEFGDAEPEDSWDPDDPLGDLVYNLERRLNLVRHRSLRDRLDALADGVEDARRPRNRRHLTDRDELRLSSITDDIALIRRRLDEEGE